MFVFRCFHDCLVCFALFWFCISTFGLVAFDLGRSLIHKSYPALGFNVGKQLGVDSIKTKLGESAVLVQRLKEMSRVAKAFLAPKKGK